MTDSNDTSASGRESLWLLLPAAIAVLAILLGFFISRERPFPAVVDGFPVNLAEGTTVGELQRSGAFTARPGRLLSVKGSVLETAGGEPIRILVNGHEVEQEQTVFRRNVVTSVGGVDVTEATRSVREPIPVKTRITGHGPVMRLSNPGSLGVRMRVVGLTSKETLSERIVVPMQNMVVVRTRPHPQEKLIALTFDDGPWPGQTDKILKILKRENVRATFFMVGVRVRKAPALARKIAKSGNVVGNHSLGHRQLTKSKPKEIKRQIDGGSDAIYKATGVLPSWFRPPYGSINAKVWKQVRVSRLHVALWTIDTRDWSSPGVKKIVKTTLKYARRGSIILMHDGGVNRKQTIKALPQIITKLKKRGFVFVTIQELADAK